MKEIGIDISSHTSKHMNQFLGRKGGYGGHRMRTCRLGLPYVPGQVSRYHCGSDDPAWATPCWTHQAP